MTKSLCAVMSGGPPQFVREMPLEMGTYPATSPMWEPPGSKYHPGLVSVPSQYKPQWEALRENREQPLLEAAYYSHQNVQFLIAEMKRRGLGDPSVWSLKPYMDFALRQDRGAFNAACHPHQYRDMAEHIEALNGQVLAMVRPIAQASKFGYEQYYRDLNFRRIPDNPRARPNGYKLNEDTLIHPYWDSLY